LEGTDLNLSEFRRKLEYQYRLSSLSRDGTYSSIVNFAAWPGVGFSGRGLGDFFGWEMGAVAAAAVGICLTGEIWVLRPARLEGWTNRSSSSSWLLDVIAQAWSFDPDSDEGGVVGHGIYDDPSELVVVLVVMENDCRVGDLSGVMGGVGGIE